MTFIISLFLSVKHHLRNLQRVLINRINSTFFVDARLWDTQNAAHKRFNSFED